VFVQREILALAMTRSFGDVLIKDLLADNFECAFETGFTAPLILAEPEVQTEKVSSDDVRLLLFLFWCLTAPFLKEFLLVACDGLYDVFSSQEAVDFVHAEISKGSAKSEVCKLVSSFGVCADCWLKIADKLITRAIELGTLDNVSVQIVFFDHSKRK
jgi:serine/threonine protein phosphatase PrpC